MHGDRPESCWFFSKRHVATRVALAAFEPAVILQCQHFLQEDARGCRGLDYIQAFEDHSNLEGADVVRFSLVTVRREGGDTPRMLPTRHRVAAHGKLADVIKPYVVKGQRVYVEGRLAGSMIVADNLIC